MGMSRAGTDVLRISPVGEVVADRKPTCSAVELWGHDADIVVAAGALKGPPQSKEDQVVYLRRQLPCLGAATASPGKMTNHTLVSTAILAAPPLSVAPRYCKRMTSMVSGTPSTFIRYPPPAR